MSNTDSDEWEDCEEATVLVEIQGIIKPDFLKNVERAKVLGINTETPYLQLDDNTFSGNYQDSMGTCLLFKDKTEYNTEGLEEGPEIQHELEYSCKTYKKLCLQRVFIKDRKNMGRTNPEMSSGEEKSTQENSERPTATSTHSEEHSTRDTLSHGDTIGQDIDSEISVKTKDNTEDNVEHNVEDVESTENSGAVMDDT